ncbi:MAG TPA: T9SS type A sorting domain-containing protein [Ignavibacteriaceae bacterium]|nr:T9SS type A sorting domain-containing protein [Ignavibacteriaceae bacterium]
MYSKKVFYRIFLSLFLVNIAFASGKNGGDKTKTLNKTTDAIRYTHFNINKISTFIYNNGDADLANNSNSGLIYPKGSGKTAVFESGLVWGGKVDGQIRVGGSTYGSGLLPGKIISKGVAANPEDIKNRVYRVRPDYKTADLSSEVNDREGTPDQIREQYKKDWIEWPAADGAPYKDVDGNGIYNPSVDIPGVPGSDQTLWFVANDLDSVQAKSLYGSTSMGIEMQVTVWGYNQRNSTLLNNMFFKKYKVINKSDKNFTDMYFGYWSDVDDGNAGDDVDGCDTLLDLGYTYNYNAVDATYTPLPPPAVGFTFLQGPIVPGVPGDTAMFDGKFLSGKKNLGMTSIGYIHKSSPEPYSEPALGSYKHGTLYIYNYMQGKINDGRYYPIPESLGGGNTPFPYSGDPVNKTGWLDGTDLPPGDRRIMINSGAFNMAPGDTQEVVLAEIVAGAEPGLTNLSAVTLLKQYTKAIRQIYKNGDPFAAIPDMPRLTASDYDNSAVLSWGDEPGSVRKVEDQSYGKYNFEGYNIYQLPTDSSGLDEGVKIATFDRVDDVTNILDYFPEPKSGKLIQRLVQSGTDSGVRRYININRNYLNKDPLHNGAKYYFAVTAYNYNPDINATPRSNESYLNTITVIPRTNNPGVRYGAEYGTVLNYSHNSGNSTGMIEPVVIDPQKLNGHKYKVSFYISGTDTLWSLTDMTTGNLKFDNQRNQSGDDDYLIADGILVKVINDKTNPNTPADVFTFTAPVNTNSTELAKSDVEKINVYPNPYYGANPAEETNAGKFVTFTHLPQKATIRIFDLAGRLVRTMEKDSPDQFYKFYLFTNAYTPLGSGIYIAYIEMPELKTTKILKFAIITPQVVPDHY